MFKNLFKYLLMVLLMVPLTLSNIFLFIGKVIIGISEILRFDLPMAKREFIDAFNLYH